MYGLREGPVDAFLVGLLVQMGFGASQTLVHCVGVVPWVHECGFGGFRLSRYRRQGKEVGTEWNRAINE
jgi:hypothetical protein